MSFAFENFKVNAFNETDWSLVTREDGSIDIASFLALVGKKLNLKLTNEEEFTKSFVIIASIEHLLGPFNRDQAIAMAIMYSLVK